MNWHDGGPSRRPRLGSRQDDGRRGRVAVFAAHYPPHVGGVERYTLSLWSHLSKRGWEVLVVTADVDGPSPEPAPPGTLGPSPAPASPRISPAPAVRVAVLPSRKVLEGRVPVPVPSRELTELWRALRASPPDVVVSNTRFFPTSWLAAALARHTRRPLLHIEHGSASVRIGSRMADAVTGTVDRAAGGWVLRRAARCAGVSTAVADYLGAERGVCDPGLLPNGVETDGWDRAEVDYRALLGLRPTDLLVVHAGRLIAAKGVQHTLAAFETLREPARDRLCLAVAGDGPLAAKVRRAEAGGCAGAEGRVAALGSLNRDQIHDLLVAADVVVHPSSYPEGLPSVLLEAAAAGAAIVATPAGGTTDLVRHDETGLIVPLGDPRRLAEALELLASDDALRERLAAAALHLVRERFEWRVVANALERELDGLVASSPPLALATVGPLRFD